MTTPELSTDAHAGARAWVSMICTGRGHESQGRIGLVSSGD